MEKQEPTIEEEYLKDELKKYDGIDVVVLNKPEEPKQETLEEAAEKHIPNRIRSTAFGGKFEWEPRRERKAFIRGYKLAQERMYSEMDIVLILSKFRDMKMIAFSEWFEKFKK